MFVLRPLAPVVFFALFLFLFLCVCVRRAALTLLNQGDTLAIDGSGWMFQLLLGQRVDHGGDYDLFHRTIVREVARLRKVSTRCLRKHAPKISRVSTLGAVVVYHVFVRIPHPPGPRYPRECTLVVPAGSGLRAWSALGAHSCRLSCCGLVVRPASPLRHRIKGTSLSCGRRRRPPYPSPTPNPRAPGPKTAKTSAKPSCQYVIQEVKRKHSTAQFPNPKTFDTHLLAPALFPALFSPNP